jgi:hypothetical protein
VHAVSGTPVRGPAQAVPGGPARSGFQRQGRLARVLPFAAVAAIAEASLALPPGPQSAAGLAVSLALLAVTAGAVMLPWERLPRQAAVLVPLAYLGSVLGLTVASGGTRSGVELVLLVPVVWTALYHEPWESGCVLAAFAGAAYLASVIPDGVTAPILARRELFLAAVAIMISAATHLLRRRIRRSQAAATRLQAQLRELSIVADRERIAASLHDTVVQRLFTAGLSLQGIRPRCGPPEVTSRIDAVVQNLDDAIKLLRQTIFGLTHGLPVVQGGPEPAQAYGTHGTQGLRRAVLDVSSELTPLLGAAPEVVLDGPIDTAIPPGTAGELLTALREALVRIGAPAATGRVAVAVVATAAEVTVTVTAGDQRQVWRTPLAGAPSRQPDPPATAPDAALAVDQGAPSYRRPSQIPVSHSPAKITPSAYITGTMTPEATTAACSTVPATSAQEARGRPATAASATAAPASTPPATPATRGAA